MEFATFKKSTGIIAHLVLLAQFNPGNIDITQRRVIIESHKRDDILLGVPPILRIPYKRVLVVHRKHPGKLAPFGAALLLIKVHDKTDCRKRGAMCGLFVFLDEEKHTTALGPAVLLAKSRFLFKLILRTNSIDRCISIHGDASG